MLRDGSNGFDLSICPIVGIGGFEKTTLAQLVYSDEEVVNEFDTRIWVRVSEDFSIKRVTKMIIDHLTEKKCDLEELSPMQNLLKKLLCGRRYLLVLDDVWDYSQGNWNAIIMFLLKCGAKESAIIVTTRLSTVVAITHLSSSCISIINPAYHLKCLQEHDSWSLFEHFGLGVRDKGNEDFIEIGKSIVAKCKGVPLAILAVGSLLNSKRNEGFWIRIKESEIWQLEEGEDTNLPALRLSYQHLPPAHRQCFAYFSVYPKDWAMSKERLIHGWMASGFIQSRHGMEAEDIGDDMFNGLLQRSFFQEHESESKTTKVKMHDLLHDLACSVTKNECWRMKTCFSRATSLKHLRVLELGGIWNLNSIPHWIGNLRLLKWLDIENTGITALSDFVCGLTNLNVLLLDQNGRLKALPSSVGKLKNLRYLDLSESSIQVLPEFICTLTNLQTLGLRFCEKLERLPRDMKSMKSLRKLIIAREVDKKLLISGMPVGIGELLHMEMLRIFLVSNASDGALGIQELGRLNKLKGELIIDEIRHVLDPRDARQANLKNKDKLSTLILSWGSCEDDAEVENEEEMKRINQVLESLEPHPNLRMLRIREYPGVELPGWVGNSDLRDLDVVDMHNAVHVFHQLPPNLVNLWIVRCPILNFHPELRFPSSIKSLSVGASNDPTLRSVEALPHLSHLQIQGFHEQKILLGSSALRNLTCLTQSWIGYSSDVKRLLPKLENLTCLRQLDITLCDDLDCITEEGWRNLASLQTLKLRGCRGMTSLSDSPSSLADLKSLTRLDIVDCPKLVWSAVEFQHLVALKHLILKEFPQLTSLPNAIQHLTTLQYLFIWSCQNLTTLPQSLPPTLFQLEIKGCHPELHRRCEVDKGDDWHKISHLQVNNIE